MQSSVLTLSPKLRGLQSSASLQERQPQGFDVKPSPHFRSTKSCDLTLRSKLCEIKSMTVGSRLHLHDGKSPRLQEVKLSQSTPGTQHQGRKSLVLTQKPQLPEEKSEVLSQGSQEERDKTTELNFPLHLKRMKRMKSSELSFQTKLQHTK